MLLLLTELSPQALKFRLKLLSLAPFLLCFTRLFLCYLRILVPRLFHLRQSILLLPDPCLGLLKFVPLLAQFGYFLSMHWRHLRFEFEEVKHLMEHGLPLERVLLGRQDQIEAEGQVLVDPRHAFVHEHV